MEKNNKEICEAYKKKIKDEIEKICNIEWLNFIHRVILNLLD